MMTTKNSNYATPEGSVGIADDALNVTAEESVAQQDAMLESDVEAAEAEVAADFAEEDAALDAEQAGLAIGEQMAEEEAAADVDKNDLSGKSKQELIDMYQNNDGIEFSYLKTDIYTMDMTQDDYRYTVTVSEEFYDALASVGIELEEWQSFTFDYSQDITPAMVLNSLCCGEIIPLSGGEVDYELINKFNEAITLWDDIAIEIEVEAYSEFGTEYFYFYLIFDQNTIGSISTNVELNQSSIIF